MPCITDARRADRRSEIIAAATRCFARLGFHRTTMRDIIAEGGLSAGGVYRHFRSKDEIIAEIAVRRRAREDAFLAAAATQPDPIAALKDIGRQLLQALDTPEANADRRVGAQVWAEALHQPVMRERVLAGLAVPIEHVTALVEPAIREGRIRFSGPPETLARSLIAALHGMFLQKLWEPALDVAILRQGLDALIDGVANGGAP